MALVFDRRVKTLVSYKISIKYLWRSPRSASPIRILLRGTTVSNYDTVLSFFTKNQACQLISMVQVSIIPKALEGSQDACPSQPLIHSVRDISKRCAICVSMIYWAFRSTGLLWIICMRLGHESGVRMLESEGNTEGQLPHST